jgi:hypothetical protein
LRVALWAVAHVAVVVSVACLLEVATSVDLFDFIACAALVGVALLNARLYVGGK